MIGVISMIRYLFVLLFLTSCNNLPIAYIQNFSSVNNVIFGFPENEITQEIFDDYEYSFIKMRFKRGPHSILILSYINDDIYEWAGNDGVKIYTQNGRVIKTFGLTHDFEILNPVTRTPEEVLAFNCDVNKRNIILDFFMDHKCNNGTFRSSERVNFYDPDLIAAPVRITFQKSSEVVKRLGKKSETQVLKEYISMPSIGWKKENNYYANLETGVIEKSEQFLHPRLPVARVEFYYKY